MAKPKHSASWNKKLTGDTQRHSERVALQLYASLDTPVSLSCYILLKHREYAQLVDKDVSPLDYNDAYKFRSDWQAVNYLSKYQDFDLGVDRKKVAYQKFLDAEAKCKETNRIFKARKSGVISTTPGVEQVLFYAQRKISHVLGEWRNALYINGSFGPGVTSSCTGDQTGLAEKFRSEIDATRDSLKLVKPLFGVSQLWSKAQMNDLLFSEPCSVIPVPRVVEFDRLAFVPKKANTDRTVGIPATFNIYLQKAVGSHMRKRLRLGGVDLNSQLRNQELARLSSVTGHLATLDLKSASDTISIEVVWDLLPYEWARRLDDIRHKYYQNPDGEISRYEKFSAMGNGFTFELESLLFFGLCVGTCQHLGLPTEEIGIYGDDLIVPTDAAPLLTDVLSYCGFTLNKQKSFTTSAFRESCGADWFLGINVRPIFLKEEISDTSRVYRAANNIFRLASKWGSGPNSPVPYLDSRFQNVHSMLYNLVPLAHRYSVPEGYGDYGFVSSNPCPLTLKNSLALSRDYQRQVFVYRAPLALGVRYRTRNDPSVLIQCIGTADALDLDRCCRLDLRDIRNSKVLSGHILSNLVKRIGSESQPTHGQSVFRKRVRYVRKLVVATTWPDHGDWL